MLSKREKVVAERYAAGKTYKQIAAELYIAPATVRNHLAAIYRKLGVDNKAKLISIVLGKTPGANIPILPSIDSPTRSVLQMLDGSALPHIREPSIAIMPFATIGGSENEYFSNGVTVNIHNNLTRYRDLFVSGRSSCNTLNGLTEDVSEISKGLGVQFVIRGTVRSYGNSARITAELIDGTTGNTLWSEQFERALHDIFEVEAEVADTIAGNLSLKIEDVQYESRKHIPSEWLSAYELQLRGSHYLEAGGEENIQQAKREFSRALENEPGFAGAWAGLSMCYGLECDQLLARDYSVCLERHLEFAEKAISLDELDSRGHYAMVCALILSGQFDLADRHAERAMELNPAEYHNLCNRGYTLMALGKIAESISCFNDSLRRNPLAPNSCLLALGLIEYLEKNYAHSAFAFSSMSNSYLQRNSSLAAAYGQLGYKKDASLNARLFQREAKGRSGCPSAGNTRDWKNFWSLVYPYVKQDRFEHLIEGVSKAGLPV